MMEQTIKKFVKKYPFLARLGTGLVLFLALLPVNIILAYIISMTVVIMWEFVEKT